MRALLNGAALQHQYATEYCELNLPSGYTNTLGLRVPDLLLLAISVQLHGSF